MSSPVPGSLPSWLFPLREAVREACETATVDGRSSLVPKGANGRRSAVLILFGQQGDSADVLLSRRAVTLSSHPGQPAFPGGVTDEQDRDAPQTALREAHEEVGLDRTGVRIFAQMPDLWVPPSGFIVSPVMGWWHTPGPVHAVDPSEVDRVERVPISDLVDPANRCVIRHPSGFAGPAFTVAGLLVWGFTAMVLDWVLQAGGWSLPWDRDDVRDLPREMWDLATRTTAAERIPDLGPDAPVPTQILPPPPGRD